MWKSNDKSITFTLLNKRKALSLVELVIITFILAIIATIAFPTYKIFQQRSKEKRLKKILTDVRAAINGSKSHNSSNYFEEGFRTVARMKGIDRILLKANLSAWSEQKKQQCISAFLAQIGEGYCYPASPKDIWSPNPYATFPDKLTGFDPENPLEEFSFTELGDVPLERPFYRNSASGPVHPFHDWYPSVEFQYVPVVDNTGNASGTTYTYNGWETNKADLKGVRDIVSRGAGLALDGSNTDDW